MRFRWNRFRNRWFQARESARETAREVFIEQKMCPACRALTGRHSRQCPYCGEPLRVIGTGPAGRLASRFLPASAPLTTFLLAGNLFMFAVEIVLTRHGNLIHPVGNGAELRLGLSLPLQFMLASGQYWRWITAMFLHAGWLHIGFNMWALYDLGPICEELYGPQKFLALYIASGIVGNIVASAAGTAVLGASGALFGLLGMLAVYGLRRHDAGTQQLRSGATRWIIYALIWTFAFPGISLAAHLGGLISGGILAFLISDEPPLTEASIGLWRAVQILAIVVTLGSFVFMVRTPLG